ncbi:hypothetical protein MtrunA17_Chr6g0477761 [Medicago truncatula]|uniref:Uncharacterized protein n=1 Tax=Medicago truncatula TaxID=3880 RepID=A0A396HFT5_MEDTR|nr:hypothetical protein MtrunA17_Chr6g0477761 [Medicago truncatula]
MIPKLNFSTFHHFLILPSSLPFLSSNKAISSTKINILSSILPYFSLFLNINLIFNALHFSLNKIPPPRVILTPSKIFHHHLKTSVLNPIIIESKRF